MGHSDKKDKKDKDKKDKDKKDKDKKDKDKKDKKCHSDSESDSSREGRKHKKKKDKKDKKDSSADWSTCRKSHWEDSALKKVTDTHDLMHPKTWCVTVPDCEDLVRKIPAGTSSPDYPKSPWSMGCVVKHIVKPETLKFDRRGRTSYARMLHPKGLKIKVFVSHAWREPYKEFVASIRKFRDANFPPTKDERRGFWICALGLPQNDDKILAELLDDKIPIYDIPFAAAMWYTKYVLCVRNSAVDLHSRPWCLFEMKAAVSFTTMKEDKGNRKIRIRACGPKKFTDSKNAHGMMLDALAKVKKKSGEDACNKACRHDYKRILKELTVPGALEVVEDVIDMLALNSRDDKPDKYDESDSSSSDSEDEQDPIVMAAAWSKRRGKANHDKIEGKDKIKKQFAEWDKNGDGFVSRDELFDVLKKLNPNFTKGMADSLFDGADTNKDGKLDLDEFIEYIFKSK